jgi:hypothetical protein
VFTPELQDRLRVVDPRQLASGALRLVRAMADGSAHEQRFEGLVARHSEKNIGRIS